MFVGIEAKVVKLGVSKFDESVEKGSNFESGRIVIDGGYLWSIPFVVIILN